MVDEISESVELRLIDTATLAAEQKKLRELKKLARESDEAKKNLTSGVSPVGFGPAPDRLSGVLKSDLKAQTRKGAVTGANTNNAFRESQKKIKEAETKIKELEKKQKEVKKQVTKIQDDFVNKLEGAQDILSSGSGVGASAAILSRFGPIGVLVASIVIPIISEFQRQFQRGGVFSLFIKEKIQVRTIIDEEELNQVRSGNKFLTSDLRVVQGIPQHSNTQNLKYEHIRFVAQTLGQ